MAKQGLRGEGEGLQRAGDRQSAPHMTSSGWARGLRAERPGLVGRREPGLRGAELRTCARQERQVRLRLH